MAERKAVQKVPEQTIPQRKQDRHFSDLHTLDPRKFEDARRKVITFESRVRHGIGMQKEKTLHSILKNYFDPDEDHQEIPISGNYIADIWDGNEIIEIQNGNFYKMRDKLKNFLASYRVRVVYPIPADKFITWIDPETGLTGKRNRSPKHGSFYEAFRELYRIRPLLSEPNLTIHLMLIDMEEYRVQDGWDRSGKRGSHRYDRIPMQLRSELILTCPQDYLAFLPYDLKEPFTSRDFAKSAGVRSAGFTTALQILTDLHVVERIGKKGRSYLYRISPDFTAGAADEKRLQPGSAEKQTKNTGRKSKAVSKKRLRPMTGKAKR